MQILVTTDATTLGYWLNWRVLICGIWVLAPMLIASYIICKYERSDHSNSEEIITHQDKSGVLCDEDAWRPCLKEIHPFWLLAFRLIAFLLLLGTIILDLVVHGGDILYYYTQWTYVLVTIYFGIGSLLSIYGCSQHNKMCAASNFAGVGQDAEQGLYVPLTYSEAAYKEGEEKSFYLQVKNDNFPSVLFFCHAFQVIFQMCAGAVMLTDLVYWSVIYPFLTLKDYDMNYLTVITHSLNAILLLGDTALNSLRFPWFRMSYFILWTAVYVIVQWIVHACISLWWPYPFLDLSLPNAPFWVGVVRQNYVIQRPPHNTHPGSHSTLASMPNSSKVFVGVLDAYSLLRCVCANNGFKTLRVIEMVPSIIPRNEIKAIPSCTA